jgi:hypothetical protein
LGNSGKKYGIGNGLAQQFGGRSVLYHSPIYR